MNNKYPKITIVTPSYNQAEFLEETICSVIEQDYPHIEYIIQDGGSTDGSVDIIKKYGDRLAFWESGPDGGQSAAINKGFSRATGEYLMWINSDDRLEKNAVRNLVETGQLSSSRILAGKILRMNVSGEVYGVHQGAIHSFDDLMNVKFFWYNNKFIMQPETIFPRKAFDNAGGLDEDNYFCMDFDLWAKMLENGLEVVYVDVPVAAFRFHGGQKTTDAWGTMKNVLRVARIRVKESCVISDIRKKELLDGINAFEKEYWEGSGRLTEWGVPRCLAAYLRKLHNRWFCT